VAVLWSSNFAAVKILGTALPPADAAAARFALAAAVLAPALLRAPQRRPGAAPADDDVALPDGLALQSMLCGFWVTIGYVAQAVALQTTDAGKSAFICSLAVIFVPVVTSLFPQLRVAGKAAKPSWPAAVLAALGVGLMELSGKHVGVHAGDLWAVVMMGGFAMGFVENERALHRFPRHALQVTALQLSVIAAASAAWAIGAASLDAGALAVPDLYGAVAAGGWQVQAAIAYTGLVTTAATIWLENVALVHVSASEMAVILSTEPLFASAIAGVLLHETMGPGAVAGGALILCACLLNQVASTGGARAQAALRSVPFFVGAKAADAND
jgi:drug/metabolite transporter (DMT)-like permease